MNSFIMEWAGTAGLVLCLLVILYLIPITSAPTQLVFKGIGFVLVTVLVHKKDFIVWFVKKISGDHMELMKHAFKTEEEIDPTQEIRNKGKGY